MSADRKQTGAKANPYVLPQISDAVTMEQVREFGDIYLQQYRQINEMYQDTANHLKGLLKDTGLEKWIIAAGVGAILEALHIVWLAIRYIFRF